MQANYWMNMIIFNERKIKELTVVHIRPDIDWFMFLSPMTTEILSWRVAFNFYMLCCYGTVRACVRTMEKYVYLEVKIACLSSRSFLINRFKNIELKIENSIHRMPIFPFWLSLTFFVYLIVPTANHFHSSINESLKCCASFKCYPF